MANDPSTAPSRARRVAQAAEAVDTEVVNASVRAAETASLQAAEALAAAEKANAALAESLKAAEAMILRITRETEAAREAAVKDGLKRLAEATEAATATLPKELAAQVKAAEAAVSKAAEAAGEGLAANVKAAEAAGDRLRAGAKEAVAAAEESFGRLTANVEADIRSAQQAASLPQTALAGVGSAGTAVAENVARVRQQVAEFVADRIRQDLEVQSELLGCRNIEQLGAVQSKFFRNAVDQYVTESARMLSLGTEMMTKSLSAGAR